MVLIFGLALFLLSSIQLFDALAIIAVVTTQVTLGGLIWRKIRGAGPLEHSEFLGMGSATGFSLALLSSQIFRGVLPRSVGWLVLLVVALVLLRIFYRAPVGETNLENEQPINRNPRFELLVICCGTLVALSTSWYWLVPTALVSTGFVAWLLLRENFAALGAKSYWAYKVILIPLGYYAVRALLNLTHVETIRNPNWWSLRFGVLQDPDVVFNESMINSVQRFGASDNIFFAGYPLQYHWLSFAWEATLRSLRDLAPFAVSGIAAPAIVYFFAICMIHALTKRISHSNIAAASSVAIATFTSSTPIPLFQFFNPFSFSFNFSVIFFLAILFLLMHSDFVLRKSGYALFALLVLVAVGSKISNFVGLLFGITPILILAILRRRYFRDALLISLSMVLPIFLLLFFGYGSSFGSGDAGVKFDFGELFIQKANIGWQDSRFELIFGFLAVGIAIFFPISGILLLNRISALRAKTWVQFTCFSGLGLCLSAFIVADNAESSNYLLGMGLATLLPLSVAIIALYWIENGMASFQSTFFAIFMSVFSSIVSVKVYERAQLITSNTNYFQSLSILIPCILAIFMALVVFAFSDEKRITKSIIVCLIFLSASRVGLYVSHSFQHYRISVFNRDDTDTLATNYVGSREYRELLNWLKLYSTQNDLVASNRQCMEVQLDLRKCLMLWCLTSAFTGRQNLVEGLWPPFSEELVGERVKRQTLVIGFVDNPSDENRDALVAYGVKWVIADRAITNTRDWQPFATVRFENPAGSILELNP